MCLSVSFGMAASFQIIAILYIVFFIKEVKPIPKSIEKAPEDTSSPLPAQGPPSLRVGSDNLAYEQTGIDEVDRVKNVSFELNSRLQPSDKSAQLSNAETAAPIRRSFLREFFDPTLVIDCIKFPLVKRPNHGRMLLILLLIAYFLTLGPVSGKSRFYLIDSSNIYMYVCKCKAKYFVLYCRRK